MEGSHGGEDAGGVMQRPSDPSVVEEVLRGRRLVPDGSTRCARRENQGKHH
jgi:hypothetical protein